MGSPIKVFKDNSHYYIRIVDRLPKRGNANALYFFKGKPLDAFYRWDTFDYKYEKINITGTGGPEAVVSTEEVFTATEGQTVFILNSVPNNVTVHSNTVKQFLNLKYTISESEVTLIKPASAGDIVEIRKY